jgi:phage terminase large subunit-like protein
MSTQMKIETIGPQGPSDSPQNRFLSSPADYVIFNGQPGSGKTAALTLDQLRGARLPLYRGACFRRQANQLVGGGSLWDLARRWFPLAGAKLVAGRTLTATFPSGAQVEYHHLNHETDKTAHDGKSYEGLTFDELPHFTQSQFWYLTSRNRGVSGYRETVRASTMAAPDTWVHELVRPWLDAEGRWPDWTKSGQLLWMLRNPFSDVLEFFGDRPAAVARIAALRRDALSTDSIHRASPKSITVVHSLTQDNRFVGASYDNAMLTAYERNRLAGDWHARPPSSGMFNRQHLVVHDRLDPGQILFSVRGWDRAASPKTEHNDPDWTRGVRLDLMRSGQVVISDVVSLRDAPGEVTAVMTATLALDGPEVLQACWINPGDSGIFEQESLLRHFKREVPESKVVFLRQSANKEAYAKPTAAYFDPTVRGVKLGGILRAQWNGECLAEAELFPLKKHPITGDEIKDDFVDALSRAFIEVEKYLSGKSSGLLGWSNARVRSR